MTSPRLSRDSSNLPEDSKPNFSLALFAVTLALCCTGGLMLYTGLVQRENCEVQRSLPIWLVIAGGLVCSLGTMGLIYHCTLVCRCNDVCSPKGCVGTTVCALSVACLVGSLGVLLSMFALCVWVAGSFMVFEVIGHFRMPQQSYHTQYQEMCSWWLLIISIVSLCLGWFLALGSICCLCLTLCRRGRNPVFGRQLDLDNLVMINASTHVYDQVARDEQKSNGIYDKPEP